MKFDWIRATLLAAIVLTIADPSLARVKHRHRVQTSTSQCNPAPARFWFDLWSRPEPQPNGCAPAVYQYGKFVGQDPDPNIRQQLLRDPATGYTTLNNN
jgi:hypothetical protein